jgi:hypothetical protein
MNHTEIIQKLIDKIGYESYLEIGTQKRKNFGIIRCKEKVGIDPVTGGVENTLKLTSDEFFGTNRKTFDIIFIDGDHREEQVEKDLQNALSCLNAGGIIVVHDLLPETEAMQAVPRTERIWTGDGWKAFARLKAASPELLMETVDTDFGCGLVSSMNDWPNKIQPRKTTVAKNLTWEYFKKNRDRIMGVITVDEFVETYLPEEESEETTQE